LVSVNSLLLSSITLNRRHTPKGRETPKQSQLRKKRKMRQMSPKFRV
jgi:hypothetical protein